MARLPLVGIIGGCGGEGGGGTVSAPVSSGSSVWRCRGGSQSQTLYPLVAVSVGVEGGGGYSLGPCILWWQCLEV